MQFFYLTVLLSVIVLPVEYSKNRNIRMNKCSTYINHYTMLMNYYKMEKANMLIIIVYV